MILMYHKVDLIKPSLWWVTPEDLDRQLSDLKHRQFVSLDHYTAPNSQVVLTFDDAYENVYHHALPVLRAHDVPFEVFVVGDTIGGWNDFDRGEPPTRHMGLEHLDTVVRHGGQLQWHTKSHRDLTGLGGDELEDELTVPAELRARYPEPHFAWLAYPGGSQDESVVAVARQNFAGAVSVLTGRPGDRWRMNRVTVDGDTSFARPYLSRMLSSGRPTVL